MRENGGRGREKDGGSIHFGFVYCIIYCMNLPVPSLSSSIPHHKKTRHFWWVNGADKKHLQNFLLFEAEYRRYIVN